MADVKWSDLVTTVKVEASAFEKGLGGGSFFEVGKHENVMIAEVEPKVSKAGNAMVVVTFENDQGATIKKYVTFEQMDKKTGNKIISGAYRGLAAAILGLSSNYPDNQTLRTNFFSEYLLANPQAWEKLVGSRLTINIKQGNSGSIIKDVDGGKILFDVETQEQWVDTEIYADYNAAKDARKELQIPPCYNEVSATKEPVATEEIDYMAENVKMITKIMSGPKPLARPVVSI
jgi:hypothetical protein